MSALQAVVFDMDGLMFDTERLTMAVWQAWGAQNGFAGMDGVLMRTLGTTVETMRIVCAEMLGPAFPFETFRTQTRAMLDDAIRTGGMPVKHGLAALLEALAVRRVPIAVATSTSRAHAMWYLSCAGLDKTFGAVVCGDMIARSKPAPDIYLKACALLGAQPARSMALEDSYNGIRAAHAGGLLPVMVPDLVQPDKEITALLWRKADTLADVIPLLAEAEAAWGEA